MNVDDSDSDSESVYWNEDLARQGLVLISPYKPCTSVTGSVRVSNFPRGFNYAKNRCCLACGCIYRSSVEHSCRRHVASDAFPRNGMELLKALIPSSWIDQDTAHLTAPKVVENTASTAKRTTLMRAAAESSSAPGSDTDRAPTPTQSL